MIRVMWSTFCLLLLTFVGTAYAEPMSAAMGLLYGSLGSSALGAIGSLFGGKNKGKSGVTQPQVVTMPQYSFTEPRLNQTSDFISQNIQRMSEGKLPAYLDKAMPSMRNNMARQNRSTYFGSPGQGGPGVLDAVKSAGAATGIGPKATMMQTNKALYDYGTREKEIDEYLTKLGVDVMQEDAYRFPSMSMQMPKGPDAQIVGGQSYNQPQKPDYMGQAIGAIGNAVGQMDWGGGTSGGGGAGGTWDTDPQRTGMWGYDQRDQNYQQGMETPEQYAMRSAGVNDYSSGNLSYQTPTNQGNQPTWWQGRR